MYIWLVPRNAGAPKYMALAPEAPAQSCLPTRVASVNRFILGGNRFEIMGENAGSIGARNMTRSYRNFMIFALFES